MAEFIVKNDIETKKHQDMWCIVADRLHVYPLSTVINCFVTDLVGCIIVGLCRV